MPKLRVQYVYLTVAAVLLYVITLSATFTDKHSQSETARLRRHISELQPAAQMVPALLSDLEQARSAYETANDVAKANLESAIQWKHQAQSRTDDTQLSPEAIISQGEGYTLYKGFLRRGEIAEGVSATFLITTVEKAKTACNMEPTCKGFTFFAKEGDGGGRGGDDAEHEIYFKTAFHLKAVAGWAAYRKR